MKATELREMTDVELNKQLKDLKAELFNLRFQHASVWLVVKGDRKTLYEECIRQNELSRQIVIDVKGVESLTISTEYRSSDFLGGMTLAVVDIYAYRAGDGSVPVPGTVNPNKARIASNWRRILACSRWKSSSRSTCW